MVTGIKLVLQVAVNGVFILGAGQLCEASARRAGWVMALGMVALAAVLLIEARQGATIYQYLKLHIGQPIRPDLAMRNVAQGTYVLALLFWPAALCIISGPWRSYASMVVGFMGVSLGLSSVWFGADAPMAALFLGLFVLFAVQQAGALACLGFTIASLAYWLLAPLVVLFAGDLGLIGWAKVRLGPSWDARLDIWTFATDKIMQHPFRGWGLDASRAFGQAIPLHTHNGALQVWLELGVVGAVLMSLGWAGIFSLIANLVQRDRNLGAVAAASAVAYLLIGAVSFGIWQEWWLALGGLTFATIAMIDRARVSLRRQWQEAPSLERIQDKGGAQQLQQI